MRNLQTIIKATSLLLLMLTAGGSALALNGDGPVELVDINVRKDASEIVVHFNRPVFYVYHTPQTEGNSLLIGVQDTGIYGGHSNRLVRQIITFNRKLAPFIDSMEYISENGFPPYIMIDFHQKLSYRVENARDMRSLIVTIFTKTNKQDQGKP